MIDIHFLLFVFRASMAVTIHEFMGLFEGFARAAAPVVFTALWQGAVLAVGLAVCLGLARRASATHRFSIWAAGFAALVSLPFLPLLMGWVAGAASSRSILSGSIAGGASSVSPLLRLDLRWSLLIGAVWMAASAFRAVALGVHSLRLRRLWKSATRIEDDRLAGIYLSRGARRKAQVCTTKELDRPAVIGFLAPRILIPEWLFARLTRDELQHVILHESEHLRRYDDWINLAQKVCLIVFPLNPALMWIERRLCSEREMACDDGVVRATQAPRAYAACLASLAERGLKHRADALSLGAWQRRPELVQRVHRILQRTPGLSPRATRALVGALSCGLALGSIEFARCPELVAFVPAPRLTAQQSQASELGDAHYVDAHYRLDSQNAAASGFRAIDAVAQMPAATDRVNGHIYDQATRTGTAKQSGQKQAATARRNPESAPREDLREVLLKAEIPNPSAEQREEQVQPAWIVFTAWEQVETSGPDNRGLGHRAWTRDAGLRQDYESAAPDEQAAGDGKNQPDDHSGGGANSGGDAGGRTAITHQITIPQLILKIYPVGAFMTSPISGSLDSSSSADQPTAIQLRDGWFVFQL